MDPKLLEDEIRKTGFVLENRVAQILKAAGWSVISNKFYVDDFEQSVREIDLIAYQVKKEKSFDVYTVLVISCKKSDANVWAFLSRDLNIRDPNSDFWPLHAWTNDKALSYKLAEHGCARRYHEELELKGVGNALMLPNVEIFAFQEMDRKKGAPQNDKPIFSSITSLMKAQAYELGALPLRKKAPSLYQFNLISVVDAEMAQMMFSGDKITCSEIESAHYLARYIIKKKETFSRIRFINANSFAKELESYEKLHQANTTWFEELSESFYREILEDKKRYSKLMDEFKNQASVALTWQVLFGFQDDEDIPKEDFDDFSFTMKNGILQVEVICTDKVLNFINSDKESKALVAKALAKVYRYEGAFEFAEGVPF